METKEKTSGTQYGEIETIQQQIIQEFTEIGDRFDQYAYLIELACLHEPMPEEAKTEGNLVKGCQSHVWLDIRVENGILSFSSDSDTLILRGILYLLAKMFNNKPCMEIADTEVTFLSETEIMDTFESDRQKGIGYVIRTIQEAAGAAAAGL